MTSRYARHVNKRETPQSEQADARQVENSAGGYTFQLDKFGRLERFLILGSEGGTYYASEKKLVVENAKSLDECLNSDPNRAIQTIVGISANGRAPKNDPAIFALAVAAGHANPEARSAALRSLPAVCRTATHLFQFLEAVQTQRGWGRSLRRAVADWYTSKTPAALAYQVVKYRNREGWSHRDALRLSHPETRDEALDAVLRWAAQQPAAERIGVQRKGGREASYPARELPAYIAAFEELQAATDVSKVIELVSEYNFTHEMVDGKWKSSAAVWEALLHRMPQTALIRNLGKMTQVGLLAPLSGATRLAASKIVDPIALRRGRVHPFTLLKAMHQYAEGRGDKGKLTWAPSREIVDALDAGFYASFDAVEPTGKRILLALDVSGSMGSSFIANSHISAREASAAMAMATAAVEVDWACVGFTAGSCGYGGRWGGSPVELRELSISPRQRLNDTVKAVSNLPFGGTDCSLPMQYATALGLEVDAFVIYTDNETWAGGIHPHQALRRYRDKSGIPAKLIVVGMTATDFTIADPLDAGMLDVVGFDTSAPALIGDFIRGSSTAAAEVTD